VSEPAGVQVVIVPQDGRDTITLSLSRRRLKLLVAAVVTLVAAVALLAGTWWYMAARAYRAAALEVELVQLRESQAQVGDLVEQLAVLEARYDQFRNIFRIDTAQVLPELWRPPGMGARSASQDPEGSLPTSWPLTAEGYVTQGLLEGAGVEHPGVDIAVASQSYIRAAGAGLVEDSGTDPVYGNYVTIDHGEGYVSLYAHASEILVETGQQVRRNEVIALSGNSGRSTAPHLHFEIRLNGETVDPLTMVSPPG
jgi:murein DD-endopeptidase MepM/ murein hydrolase activator NlpD